MDFFSVALTILFNPALLALLLILYFAGKLLGKLSVRMNIWKFLLLAYFAVFLIQPLRDAGWFIGGVFLLGFFSNHIRRLPDILMWAESLGDIYRAYKYRHTYDDLRAWEKQQAEQERRAREETARQNTGTSSRQNAWRDDAKQHRNQDFAQGSEHDRERSGYGYSEDNDYGRLNRNSKSSGKRDDSAIRKAHLQTLGLVPGQDYTLREIKKAYNRRAIETHPDQGGSSEELRRVREAWEWLKKNFGV
jgi:hypothetical protein